MSDRDPNPRRLRLTRAPAEPRAVSLQLIERLLAASSAAQVFEQGLAGLLAELPGVEQAFLWVRDGLSRFGLEAFRGLPRDRLEGLEAVLEAALRAAHGGSAEDWQLGRPRLEAEPHALQRVLGALPAGLGDRQAAAPTANLTLPLLAEGQVWAVLQLHAPARHLGEAEAALAARYLQGVAPIMREVHLREAAQRQSLWLSAINTLLRASHDQPPADTPRDAAAAPSLELGLQDALEEATRLSGAEGARLIVFEGHALRTVAQAGWGSGLPVEAAITRQIGDRLRAGQQVGIPRYDLYPSHRPELIEAGLRSLFVLPVQRQGGEAGALLLFSTRQHWLPDAQTQELLSDMAAAIGVVRVEWALRRELAWAAYTDPLTGLGNRRAFERDLEKLRGRDGGRLGVLVLLDLDGFKAINDTYGHVHADHVLVRLGGVLRARARAGDRAYRLGGDEFALIIEGPGNLHPERTAERYRALLEEIRVSDHAHLRVSLGYAVYPGDAPDVQNLWRAADDRMYRDKALRKSRAAAPDVPDGARPLAQLDTPLYRVAGRLGRALQLEAEEHQVLRAACYMMELALGEGAPGGAQLPDELLREAARALLFVQSAWEGGERAPRVSRVLQVAQHFVALLQGVEGRAALTVEEALEGVARQAQRRFDPGVVEALRSIQASLDDTSAA